MPKQKLVPMYKAIPTRCGVALFLYNLEALPVRGDDPVPALMEIRYHARLKAKAPDECHTDKTYYTVRGYYFEYKPAPWDVAPCYSDLISAKGRDYAVLQQKFKKVAEKALQRSDKVI